jgi:ribonucleases P/MRP protein subunit RPP40
VTAWLQAQILGDTQLMLAVDNWAKSLDKGLQTYIAIFDFSKASDSVPHCRLLSKLHSYGIHGNTLQWISSFLTSRKQRVALNDSYSPWLPVTSGVPQGTVLGPLLVLIYINDINTNINLEICLFADDCILNITITSLSDCKLLQVDINTMHEWATTCHMLFNSKKCHILTITKQKNKLVSSCNLNGGILSNVDLYPYLGVIVSSQPHSIRDVNETLGSETETFGFLPEMRPSKTFPRLRLLI